MSKPRLLVVGGKGFNVPRQLGDHFEIVRHIEQEEKKIGTLPAVDYILVITNWVNHGAIEQVKKALPDVPVVWVKAGWRSMEAELVRRQIISPPAEPALDEPEPESSPAPENPGPDLDHDTLKAADDLMAEYLLLKEEREKALEEKAEVRMRMADVEAKLQELDAKIEKLRPVAEAMSVLSKAVKGAKA
ncbi:MAG: hypothetical protein ACRD1Z_19995 [Vicinamibacteria bacterium]